MVGSVRSVPEISRKLPVGIFQNISLYDGGCDGGIVAVADVVLEKLVLAHELLEVV